MPFNQVLYHSFPRRNYSIEKAINIFKSVLDFGLLVTPEIITWQNSDHEPIRVGQKRVCFTALEGPELVRHSEIFGKFSIGFKRSDLETIGITPVFYVSRSLSSVQSQNIGSFYIERISQTLVLIEQFKLEHKKIRFRNTNVSVQDIENFMRYLPCLFYPIEDLREDREKMYFSQKEWRIVGNLYYKGKPQFTRLTERQKDEIVKIDPAFFRRVQDFNTGAYRTIDQCLLIPQIQEKPVLKKIVEIVIPKELKSRVIEILRFHNINPEIKLV